MKNLLTTLIGLITLGLTAQNSFGDIKGKVLDNDTKEPIPFANVYIMLSGSPVGGATNLEGEYTIKAVPSGTYDIVASSVGYSKRTLSGIIVKPEQITFADEILLSEGDELDPIVISGGPRLIDPEETNKVSLGSVAIKNSPVKQNINQLAVSAGAGGLSVSEDGQQVYFRGARNGDVIYLVDGIKIRGGRPLLPSAAINNLSVYTGGLPAKYGDTMGGVIAVETKSYFDLYYESLRD